MAHLTPEKIAELDALGRSLEGIRGRDLESFNRSSLDEVAAAVCAIPSMVAALAARDAEVAEAIEAMPSCRLQEMHGKSLLAHVRKEWEIQLHCRGEMDRLAEENERLRAALNSDQTGLAAGLAAVIDRCKAGWWITEGRGSYEWDDERYRDETRIALEAVVQIAKLALRESGALVTATFNGPLDAALKKGA